MPRPTRRGVALAATALAVLAAVVPGVSVVPATAAGPGGVPPQTYAAAHDYCRGRCDSIMTPGNNGSATLAQILANQLAGAMPPHADDAMGKYDALAGGYPSLTNGNLGDYFNDESFVMPAADVAKTVVPGGRSDVRIVYDKQTATPHIYGTTRAGTEYGAGYAAATQRLWVMDVLRHLGRGNLSSFAGGAASNRTLESEFFQLGAYTEADRQAQITRLRHSGAAGRRVVGDVTSYVAGINRYISDARRSLDFPGEYVLTGNSGLDGKGIAPFKPTDLIAIASVLSTLFGSGPDNQLQSALVKLAAEHRFGRRAGDRIWRGFRMENNPEAVTTIHGKAFPYAASPAHPVGTAMPDRGSVRPQQVEYAATGSARTAATRAAADRASRSSTARRARPTLDRLAGSMSSGVLPRNLFTAKHSMSNALLVSGRYTDDGHPIAVFGPQTGYFAPQLLMLEDIHGPGIDAEGAAFAGLGMYVLLGRGEDYAWSATSANQDNIDTFAVPLCNRDGSRPTTASQSYVFHGRCLPMQVIGTTNAWSPTLADSTPAGSYRLQAFRTRYGMVRNRGRVHGRPVAFTSLRASYGHDADNLVGFMRYNDPSWTNSPLRFQQAASRINYTFNWFYVDAHHTAYYNSGLDPVRAPGVDPNLPVWGKPAFEWRHWNPRTYTVANIPWAAHPHVTDQSYMISWNNKIARGYTFAFYGGGPIYRSNLLDTRVRALIRSHRRITRAKLTQAMADAAVTDLKGQYVLPLLLKVIRSRPVTDPAAKAAVRSLQAWLSAGAKRKETTAGSKRLAYADAIRTMDAWWPLLAKAEFEPGMGREMYDALAAVQTVDEAPAAAHSGVTHQGSSFEHGWWSYVDDDLRSVLGQRVRGGLGRTFCGGGSLRACRALLISTLKTAAATPYTSVYPGDTVCKPGDQWCAGSIQHTRFGGINQQPINWQNRPTFQQVVQFPAHR